MSDFMQLVVTGNIVADPEYRFTPQGVAVLNFRLASNRTYGKGEDRHEDTTYIKVTVWRNAAENLSKLLHKGDKVLCVGSIKATAYTGKNGLQASLELTADNVSLMSSASGRKQAETATEQTEDIPF